MIEIDGSYGEGGGQIIRTALALSTLTQKPFRVYNIRKNRGDPGLKAQHLTAITALKEICGAKTNEVALGSTELRYIPGPIKAGKFSFDIGTAGSITLLLQAVLLPVMFAPRKVTLTIVGGTCGKWQAPVEYFQHVLVPFLQRFCSIDCVIKKRGYFPVGGGEVEVVVKPRFSITALDSFALFFEELRKIKPFHLMQQGELVQIKGVSYASSDLAKAQVSERQAQAAQLGLTMYRVAVDVQSVYNNTPCTGSGITLWARFHDKDDEFHTLLGVDELGERGVKAEQIGSNAAQQLVQEIDSGAAVDRHAADQLLPFLALVGKEMNVSSLSEHAKTNMRVIEKFLDVAFEVDGTKIRVRGKE